MTTKRKRWIVGATLLCAVAVAVVAAAVLLLRERDQRNTQFLTVPEGWRAKQIYAEADTVLDVPEGTTKKAAERAATKGKLKLPTQAKGNPEGFFYPATYPIRAKTTPTSLVTSMANMAHKRHSTADARGYNTLTTASIVQAEADNPEDMAKVARVIDNRLKRGMPLQMDSSINYALGRSTLNTSFDDTRLDSPYNTYRHKGLPPTPINNPGSEALKATTTPANGPWIYFVTVKPGDTRFTDSYEQHMKWVKEFNEIQKKG